MDRFFIYELLMLVFLNVVALLFALHLRRSKINSVLSEVKAYSCLFQFIVPVIHFPLLLKILS